MHSALTKIYLKLGLPQRPSGITIKQRLFMDLILRNIHGAKLCDVLWYYAEVNQKFAVIPDSTEEWT